MKREEKSGEIKSTIIRVSRDLFFAQGYDETTIRQIIKKADINISSLYHFFRDKEDILLHICLDLFDVIVKSIQESYDFKRLGKDPILEFSVMSASQLYAIEKYDTVADLYFEAHNSWRISELMMPMVIPLYRQYFHKYNPEFTDQDYYNRVITIKGMRQSFITERVYKGKLDFEVICPYFIRTALSLFNVPRRKIEAAISKAMVEIKSKPFRIYGLEI
ncbi:MAG TPA: helix-turn-helix domain-containing protein [Desulfomonilia bacterium]|nr:helix-turn-helix domain-containing protein [Desulfomonilia bacterium]